jgi:hypothetical protein
MSEKTKIPSISKSGVMPRPVLEPNMLHESPLREDVSVRRASESPATGYMTAVSEGEDCSAARDEDTLDGS